MYGFKCGLMKSLCSVCRGVGEMLQKGSGLGLVNSGTWGKQVGIFAAQGYQGPAADHAESQPGIEATEVPERAPNPTISGVPAQWRVNKAKATTPTRLSSGSPPGLPGVPPSAYIPLCLHPPTPGDSQTKPPPTATPLQSHDFNPAFGAAPTPGLGSG